MNKDNTVNVIYNDICSNMSYELNIPLYITGDEFVKNNDIHKRKEELQLSSSS